MSAPTTNTDQKSTSGSEAPAPRRRFVQYGLRLLLIGMIGCACLFGLWAAWVRPYRVQRAVVDALLSDSDVSVGSHQAEGPALKRWLVGEDMFVEYHSLTAPADLPAIKFDQLAGLVFLRELKLDHTLIGDRQLAAVTNMPLLEELSADHTSIGDDGLAACGGAPQLGSLSLRYTRVSDAGLTRVEPLPALEKIYLTGTDVTDTGITELARHPNLREVFVRYTLVTEAGAKALGDVLPECVVYYRTKGENNDSRTKGKNNDAATEQPRLPGGDATRAIHRAVTATAAETRWLGQTICVINRDGSGLRDILHSPPDQQPPDQQPPDQQPIVPTFLSVNQPA